MKYAWIENDVIRDISNGNPEELYHPEVAVNYSVEVPDEAENGDTFDGTTLTKRPVQPPVEPPAPTPAKPPEISVIRYKMLFKPQERIAAKNSVDPVIMDLQELLNDPRTTTVDLSLESIQDALDYMTSVGILAVGRKAEILTGEVK
jgi:hypothetical protein